MKTNKNNKKQKKNNKKMKIKINNNNNNINNKSNKNSKVVVSMTKKSIKKSTRTSTISIISTTLILFLLLSLTVITNVKADSISTESGNSYYAKLESLSPTTHWAGLIVNHNAQTLDDTINPFLTMLIDSPVITQVQFPGYNLKDEQHYYAAMIPSTFSTNNIINVTPSDLQSEVLFRSAEFPIFYPNYDSINDNPNKTFCCTTATVTLGGKNFTAFKTTLPQGVNYYLLKYDEGGGAYTPLFLTEIKDEICYNNLACVSEFILPVTSIDYNFYALSKYPVYDYTVYIDGTQTTTIPQTALPYNLTVQVRDAYTGQIADNVSVLIAEDQGQNIFIPYKLSGTIHTAYAIGKTDTNGYETFITAPTVYPTDPNYNIYLGVLVDGDIISSRKTLTVLQKDQIIRQSKPLQPTVLYDNAKTTVNSMNQIVNTLFKWSSQMLQAKKFKVTYDRGTKTFSYYNYQNGSSSIYLKTGAPNILETSLENFGFPQNGYVKIEEQQGYLILNPYTGNIPVKEKIRRHKQKTPVGTNIIITPTSLGVVQSNVTITFYDQSGNYLNSTTLPIDSDLNIQAGGVFYNDDSLKTIVNAMNSVVYSLFFALNN